MNKCYGCMWDNCRQCDTEYEDIVQDMVELGIYWIPEEDE